MARVQGLPAEYQAEIRELAKQLIADAGPIPEPQTVARSLYVALRRLEADGVEWASMALDANGPTAWRPYVSLTLKEDTGAVRLYNNGWVELPERYAIRPRDPQTGEYVSGFQMPLWREMTWPQFMAMLAGLSAQRDVLSSRIAAFNEIAKLRELYPESKTPGEACELHGIDPSRFELDEAADA